MVTARTKLCGGEEDGGEGRGGEGREEREGRRPLMREVEEKHLYSQATQTVF